MYASTRKEPSLLEVQRWMTTHIRQSHTTPDDLPAWFDRPGAGTITERLRIYGDGYPARLHEALIDVFPATRHLVGGDAFRELCERYIATWRPTSYSLNHAGSQLPTHLAGDELAARLPFVADLAELEWMVACAFHAHEERPLDARQLATWSAAQWAGGILCFQPAVAVVASRWPILDLLHATDTPRDAIDIQIEGRPQHVLVSRNGLEVRCQLIDAACAVAFSMLLAGQPLGDTMERLDTMGVAPDTVQCWFASWMREGLVVASG